MHFCPGRDAIRACRHRVSSVRETVSDVQAHGNRARMGMQATTQSEGRRRREEELQRRGEGGARGARRRARSEGERGLATQRHNGTGDGACSCASAESKRSDAREVLRGHVRKKHQETDRSKRARGHCAWSWERGGEVVRSAVAMARQRPREVTKALRGWTETTEVAVTEAG